MEVDYYERLGLPKNASEEEIRSAYRMAARRLHPDVNVQAGATEMFLDIKEAYEALLNPAMHARQYDRSNSEENSPIRTQIQYSRNNLSWLAEEQLVYALLEMEILPDQLSAKEKSTPINLALVLDSSTSMQGTRLDVVKSSAIELIRQLSHHDILSVVSFNDRAETILPATINLDPHISESHVRTIQAKGGTELFQGLNAGVVEVRQNLSPNYINHVILITDGHTYGDEANCLALAKKAAEMNIGISCFGIGHQWNDKLLDQLANITGGSSDHIQEPADLKTFLKHKFEIFSQIYAKGISMNLVMGSGVTLKYAYRLMPESSVLPTSSPFKLGDIPKGSQLSVLMEFLLSPISPTVRHFLLADGNLSFTIPIIGDSPIRVPLTFFRQTSANNQPHPPPRKIIEAMSRLTLYRMQEQAKMALKEGNYLEATNRLQNMATNLFSKGESDLARTILTEAKNIRNRHKMSQEGQKQVKYATRALISPSIRKKAVKS
jgi:Ca-activated chloride channel family protein